MTLLVTNNSFTNHTFGYFRAGKDSDTYYKVFDVPDEIAEATIAAYTAKYANIDVKRIDPKDMTEDLRSALQYATLYRGQLSEAHWVIEPDGTCRCSHCGARFPANSMTHDCCPECRIPITLKAEQIPTCLDAIAAYYCDTEKGELYSDRCGENTNTLLQTINMFLQNLNETGCVRLNSYKTDKQTLNVISATWLDKSEPDEIKFWSVGIKSQ